MKYKSITIKRDSVLVDANTVLKQYWYKYILYVVRLIIYEEEPYLTSVLGEALFEQFYDDVEKQAIRITEEDFTESDLSEEIINIAAQIETSLVTHENMTWRIGLRDCMLPANNILDCTDQYFKDLVIPYLQLEKDDEIMIECDEENLERIFRGQIHKNGFVCREEKKQNNPIEAIEIIKEETNSKILAH